MGVLEIEGLYKQFGGHAVLDGLDMTVPSEAIYGFIGPNGAGKTTTMKMILGLLQPDQGHITVCGQPVTYGETKSNRCVGYLPDVPEFYSYMKPMEYLALCGQIAGLHRAQIQTKSEELLFLVGLNNEKKRIGGFSRGMKQRLGIAQALINEPKLLICDEPTSALDPIGRKEILDILHAIKGKTTVLFSTHILSDVEKICDHIAVLHRGRLALCGTLSEIKKKHRRHGFDLTFTSEGEAIAFSQLQELNKLNMTPTRNENNLTIQVEDQQKGGQFLLELLTKEQMLPTRFAVWEPSLEHLFSEVVQ